MAKLQASHTESAVNRAIGQARIVIDNISPRVDHGRYSAKRTVGQAVTVSAKIFMDGHDKLAATVAWKDARRGKWLHHKMTPLGNDLWQVDITPARTGLHWFRIEAWFDQWETYRDELKKKFEAKVPVELECREGRLLLETIIDYAHRGTGVADSATDIDTKHDTKSDIELDTESGTETENGASRPDHSFPEKQRERAQTVGVLEQALKTLDALPGAGDVADRVVTLLDQSLADAVDAVERRLFFTQSGSYEIDVDRLVANFASWYELFPRSMTDSAQSHGTFDDVIQRLPAVVAMGFDVLYLPPIHPIGKTNRKGRNNNVVAAPGEPGSPYAIGSEEGGHDAAYSRLGGLEGFRRLVAAAQRHGVQMALDFAIQCSPDHPWLKEHPGWFSWRPDGSLRYAENPPKKYQDIVNVDFYAEDALPSLWIALRDIVLFWISEGVSIFRVDNPHTKPLPFWEWLICDVRKKHPGTIFLSEAFTRPAMMYHLAKIGFSQSYTYFIWRNNKQELTDYLTELTTAEPADFYRPNFFVNTPDINPYFLQTSGRPGFLIRAALAATLSGLWGVYSGFELCESAALPGKEEYLDSEKYEIKPRDLMAPGNIIAEVSRLNQIRKENPALQTHLNIRFYDSGNEQVIYFGKFTKSNFILVAISLDTRSGQEAWLEIPNHEFGLSGKDTLVAKELMRDLTLTWQGDRQHWYFDPGELPFAIWRIRPSGV